MNFTALTELFVDFAASSWRAAWLIAVLILLRRLVRGRIPAGIWFAAWIVVGVRLLAPVSLPVNWSPYNLAAMRAPIAPAPAAASPTIAASENTLTPEIEPLRHELTPVAVAAGTTWPTRLALLWLGGILVLSSFRVMAAWRFRRQIARAAPVLERVATMVRREAAAWGIRRNVWSGETNAVYAPALCGILRPRLMFPRGFAGQLTDAELRLVIRHELAHWRRRDLLAQALLQAAVVLHWYNPLAWIAARLARVDCELACDASVLRRENAEGKLAYGAALLRVVSLARGPRRMAGAIAIFEAKQHLADRVRMIAGYRASTVGRICGGLLLIALLAAASMTRESRAADRRPMATAAAAVQAEADQPTVAAGSAPAETIAAQRDNLEQVSQDRPELNNRVELPLEQRKDLSNEALKAANLEVQRAMAAAQAAEIRVQQIQELRAQGRDLTDLPFVGGQPLVVELKKHRAQQATDISKLAERYREKHPTLIEARNSLKATDREITRAVEAVCRQVEAEHDAAIRTLAQHRDQLEELKAESLQLDRMAVERTRKQRELETQMQRTAQLREQEVAAAGSPANAAKRANPTTAPDRARDEVFQVSVVGAVNTQSAVSLMARDNPIVLDAIARAGGFTANANRAAVRIIRAKPDGSRETLTLTEDITMTGTDPAARVQRGDVIVVPEKPATEPGYVNVVGAVNKPGRISLPLARTMTVIDAIAAAGGQSRLADLRKVQITRAKASPATAVVIADVDAIFKGRSSAENIVVEPGDMVFVPERIL